MAEDVGKVGPIESLDDSEVGFFGTGEFSEAHFFGEAGDRGPGDGIKIDHEEIEVHLVPRDEIPAFVERKRAEGCAIDTKMLLLLAGDILG